MGGTAQSCVAFAFAGYPLPATNYFRRPLRLGGESPKQ